MDAVNFQVLFNIACALVGALGTIVLKSVFERMKDLSRDDKELARKQEESAKELHALALSLAKDYPTKADMRDMREAMKDMKLSIDESFDRVFERLDKLNENKS